MAFDVAAAYGRFMGRCSEPLADRFVELAELLPDGPFTVDATAWTVLGRG